MTVHIYLYLGHPRNWQWRPLVTQVGFYFLFFGVSCRDESYGIY